MTPAEASGWGIGVDVSGTKVAAGFVDALSEIYQHTRVPMKSHGTAEERLAAVTAAIDELLKLAPEASGAAAYRHLCSQTARSSCRNRSESCQWRPG